MSRFLRFFSYLPFKVGPVKRATIFVIFLCAIIIQRGREAGGVKGMLRVEAAHTQRGGEAQGEK